MGFMDDDKKKKRKKANHLGSWYFFRKEPKRNMQQLYTRNAIER